MKISIDYKKITDSPMTSNTDDYFVFDNLEKISNLARALVAGTPTPLILSGYRGVGKTTYIRRLQQEIEEHYERTIFLRIDLSSYRKYPLLLRQIIRSLYLSLEETKKLNDIRKQNPEIASLLEEIYSRTFHNIEKTKKTLLTSERIFKTDFKINLRILIPLLGFVGGLIFPIFNESIAAIISVLSLIVLAAEGFNFYFEHTHKKQNSDELSLKSLYDDDIAEFHLKNLLTNLAQLKNGYRTVIVIDELDKIEKDDTVNELIIDLKPLLLSGTASFILVFGQKFYNRFYISQTNDDDMIASVFSNVEHVNFQSSDVFFKIFGKFSPEKLSIGPGSLLRQYLESKILESKRVLRKFISLIRHDIIWNDELAFIEIKEEDSNAFSTDSKLLTIIQKIEQDSLDSYPDGVKDFFIAQLHIWVQKMKLRKNDRFNKTEIFDFAKDYNADHTFCYAPILNKLITMLLDKMKEEKLIKKISGEKEDDDDAYAWNKNVAVREQEFSYEFSSNEKQKMDFFTAFLQFEKYLSNIYHTLFMRDQRTSVKLMLSKLSKERRIDAKWNNNHTIKTAVTLRNKIAHAADLSPKEVDFLYSYKFQLLPIAHSIAVEFTKTCIIEAFSLSGVNIELIHQEIHGIDIVYTTQDKKCPDFLFEVVLVDESSKKIKIETSRATDLLQKYNARTRKENYLFLLFFGADDPSNFKLLMNEVRIDNGEEILWQYVYTYFVSEGFDIAEYLKTNINSILINRDIMQ